MARCGSPIKRFMQTNEYVFGLSGHDRTHSADLGLQAV
jgi:hypothetical protein